MYCMRQLVRSTLRRAAAGWGHSTVSTRPPLTLAARAGPDRSHALALADCRRWLDLGAQLRQMKTGLGAAPYTVAGYLRCKSRLMRALMERLMKVRRL